MHLSEEQLEKLRTALEKVRASANSRVSTDVLVELAGLLPLGLGMTVDLKAVQTLGHPLVVLRPARPAHTVFSKISPQELEVAGLVAAGLRNADIAVALGIKLGTVKDHVHNILSKSGLDSRTAIASEWAKAYR